MCEEFGLLIDGAWRRASDGAEMPVESPVTEQTIGHIPVVTENDIAAALDNARTAMSTWTQFPAWERAALLCRTSDLLRERAEEIAVIMSTETDKPLAEAKGEVRDGADQFEWMGEEAKRIYVQTIRGRNADEPKFSSWRRIILE